MRVDVGAFIEEILLGVGGGKVLGFHQPADCNRGAATAPGFAVDVDFLVLGDVRFNEIHRAAYVIVRGVSEINGRHVKLFDTVLLVGLGWSAVFFARVDDAKDA